MSINNTLDKAKSAIQFAINEATRIEGELVLTGSIYPVERQPYDILISMLRESILKAQQIKIHNCEWSPKGFCYLCGIENFNK
jgi:hypothetical protein